MAPVSDEEYLTWLLEKTKTCQGVEVARIVGQGIKDCFEGLRGYVEIGLSTPEIVVRIPCSQLPEAWANFLHVFCFDDYMLGQLSDILAPGSVIVDIGAFLGFFALRVGTMIERRGLVIAVEPNPLARRVLYENLSLNRMESIARIDPRLLCGSNSYRTLLVTEYWALSSTNASYVREMGSSVVGELRLPCMTLKKLMQSHSVSRIDLLKIDIEGGEHEVLETGMKEGVLKPSLIRSIVVELHPLANSLQKSIQLITRLAHENGYELVEFNPLIPSWKQVIVLAR